MAALSLLLHLVPRCLGARNPQLRKVDQTVGYAQERQGR